MRTTLTIDDHLVRDLQDLARRSGKPFQIVVNEALQAGLIARRVRRRPKRYRVTPASLGKVREGIDLDRALLLADSLEDQAIARKIEQNR